jgi:hypothetical protein
MVYSVIFVTADIILQCAVIFLNYFGRVNKLYALSVMH